MPFWFSAAPAELVLLLVALPVTLLAGALSALRRPLPVPLAVLLPCALVAGGGIDQSLALSAANVAFQASLDDPLAATTALQARALAAAPAAVGALGGAALFAILAGAAAVGSLRDGDRRWLPLAGAFLPGVAAIGLLLVGAVVYGERSLLGGAALLGTWLWVLSSVALCGASGRPLGAMSGLLGCLSLLYGCHALFESGLHDLPLAEVRSRFAGLPDRFLLLHVSLLLLALSVPVAWVVGGSTRERNLGGSPAVVLLVVILSVPWIRGEHHRQALAEAAGAWPNVALALGAPDLPLRAPLPTRLLVGREGRFWGRTATGAGPVGASGVLWDAPLTRDDGLLLPASTPLGDFYVLLVGKELARVQFVGCNATPWGLEEVFPRERMASIGLCGAVPLELRVTGDLQDPRVLIVLPDGQVDDGGEVVDIAGVSGVEGVPVVVRGQENATIGDLLALLRHLGKAGTLYLGWGVAMDGEPLGVGVNPDLRVKVPVKTATLTD